jgi:hypothetical protein
MLINLASDEWLLDPRLLNKRLDIRISGTKINLCHGGRYEDHIGYLVLDQVPADTTKSVLIKVGYHESQLRFPIRHLRPLRTTERPPTVTSDMAQPLSASMGERVVIIGSDLEGQSDLIGYYGWTYAASEPPHVYVYAAVQTPVGYQAQVKHYHEQSLCRATAGVVAWLGRNVE